MSSRPVLSPLLRTLSEFKAACQKPLAPEKIPAAVQLLFSQLQASGVTLTPDIIVLSSHDFRIHETAEGAFFAPDLESKLGTLIKTLQPIINDRFFSLRNVLVSHLFPFLEPADSARAACVNRQLWEASIISKSTFTSQDVLDLLTHVRRGTFIVTTPFQANTLDLSECPNLTKEELVFLSGLFPHLQSLQVQRFRDVTIFLRHPSSIKELSIQDCQDLTDERLSSIRLPHLESLYLWSCPHVTDRGFSQFVQNHPGLRIVDYKNCPHMSDASVTALATSCPDLTHFLIERCPGVTNVGIIALVTNCPITYLSLSGCHELTNEALHAIADRPELTHLELHHCPLISDAGVERLAACTGISRLNITDCPEVESGLQAIIENGNLAYLLVEDCPRIAPRTLTQFTPMSGRQLSHLFLLNCPWLTDCDIEAVVDNCPWLIELEVIDCPGLTRASLRAARSKPDLRHNFPQNFGLPRYFVSHGLRTYY